MIRGPYPATGVRPGLAAELGTLWTAVTRADGAVGFSMDAPEADIRAAADDLVEDVRAGRQQLVALDADGALAGTVFLRRGDRAVVRHRADVLKLMVHPGLQGYGWGKALLDAAVAHATELGVEQLLLSTRGGTSLPEFYAKQGWTQVGLFPDALRIGPDDLRDEHWFQLALGLS